MAHILAVDDDAAVLGTLERVLQRDHFQVTCVDSGPKALAFLEETLPDLMILDIIMPDMDGIDVCRRVRHDSRFTALPVLFLTAKGTTDDIVDGLDAGADDYVVKPFEVAELRARVQALLRRGQRSLDSGTAIMLRGLSLEPETHQVSVDGQPVQLTSTEYRLLRYFLERKDQTLSLSHLLQAVWEYPEDTGDPDLVRAHVRNLRNKIEKGGEHRYIRTVHGVGYMISS